MKLLDRYKISLHNIKNNKSRSILTTAIVYIISLLIIVILCIGLSFSSNTSNIIKTYYQTSDEAINISYNNYGYEGADVLDNNVYQNLIPILEEHKSLISYSKYTYNSYGDSAFVQNHNFSANEHIEIIEGSNVNENDVNTNKVLVSAQYAQNYYNSTNTILKIGDTIDYTFEYTSTNKDQNGYGIMTSKTLSLEVFGIYKLKEVEKKAYQSNLISESNMVIVDAEYLMNNLPNIYFTNVNYYYNVSKSNFNDKELKNNLDSLVTKLTNVLPQEYEDYNSIYCNALQDLKMSSLTGTIIIAFAAFLCLVLILLSIGSLANTIMISVDKNKKFIGLLKALGLNEKDLKSTIKMESITTIILGVFLSFFTVFLFRSAIGGLNELLLSSMFSNYLSVIEYTIVFSLPIYIPFIVLIFFVFFTLLFARSSMSKIAKTDPMAVISEVA